MKKFKFTLQAVHQVRSARQDVEVSAFDKLRATADEAERSLNAAKSRHLEAVEAASTRFAAGERIDPFELSVSYEHIASLERARRSAETFLEQCRQACEEQRRNVESAARDVKVTENLKEKQLLKHHTEAARSEQAAIDELTSATIARAGGANR